MADTPGWLSPNNDAGTGGGGGDNTFEMTTGVTPEPTSGAVGGSTTTSTTAAAANDEDLPGVILTMRLANMGVAIALVACSVRTAIPMDTVL